MTWVEYLRWYLHEAIRESEQSRLYGRGGEIGHHIMAGRISFPFFYCQMGHVYTCRLPSFAELPNFHGRWLIFACAQSRSTERTGIQGAHHKYAPSPKVIPDVDGAVTASARLGGPESARPLAVERWTKIKANAWRKAIWVARSHAMRVNTIQGVDDVGRVLYELQRADGRKRHPRASSAAADDVLADDKPADLER